MGSYLFSIVLTVHVLVGLGVIALVLLQHGKGADMGAAFGSGASGSLFGASGSANFLSRSTAVLATVFLACTLGLAYFGMAAPAAPSSGSVLDSPAAVAPASGASAPAAVPAAPASGAALIPSK